MCFNCPDWVAYCDVKGCTGGSAGFNLSGPSTLRHFYLGDFFCEHLRPRYGHDVATMDDQGSEVR